MQAWVQSLTLVEFVNKTLAVYDFTLLSLVLYWFGILIIWLAPLETEYFQDTDDGDDVTQQPNATNEDADISQPTPTEEYTANTSTPRHVEVNSVEHVASATTRPGPQNLRSPVESTIDAPTQSTTPG